MGNNVSLVTVAQILCPDRTYFDGILGYRSIISAWDCLRFFYSPRLYRRRSSIIRAYPDSSLCRASTIKHVLWRSVSLMAAISGRHFLVKNIARLGTVALSFAIPPSAHHPLSPCSIMKSRYPDSKSKPPESGSGTHIAILTVSL